MRTEYHSEGLKTFCINGGASDNKFLGEIEGGLITYGFTPAFATNKSKEEEFKILLSHYDIFVYFISSATSNVEKKQFQNDIKRIELFSKNENIAKIIVFIDFQSVGINFSTRYPVFKLLSRSEVSVLALCSKIVKFVDDKYEEIENGLLEHKDDFEFLLYEDLDNSSTKSVIITDLFNDIKLYFAKHPERMYDLSPRRFEELVADILKDFGFNCELTPATRDGGYDIYAQIKNSVTSFLMYVECKKYNPSKKVGVEVIRSLHGTSKIKGANKSMIVTTSFFTETARKEHSLIKTEMDLKDFQNLRDWLGLYL